MTLSNMKKNCFYPIVFLPLLLSGISCVCMSQKEFCAKNEEIKSIRLDLQYREKTIAELLNRLSLKDQEIGKLTNELQTAEVTIEDLKSNIEKLREVDVQVEEKKKEVDNSLIEETMPTGIPETTPGTESSTIEEQ